MRLAATDAARHFSRIALIWPLVALGRAMRTCSDALFSRHFFERGDASEDAGSVKSEIALLRIVVQESGDFVAELRVGADFGEHGDAGFSGSINEDAALRAWGGSFEDDASHDPGRRQGGEADEKIENVDGAREGRADGDAQNDGCGCGGGGVGLGDAHQIPKSQIAPGEIAQSERAEHQEFLPAAAEDSERRKHTAINGFECELEAQQEGGGEALWRRAPFAPRPRPGAGVGESTSCVGRGYRDRAGRRPGFEWHPAGGGHGD